MTTHTKDFEAAFHSESSNYCSGHDTTANTPTELLEADLTAFDRIRSVETIGIPKPIYELIHDVGSSEFGSSEQKHFTQPGEGSLEMFLQTKNFCDMVVSESLGVIPNSFDIRFNDGDSEKDIYGCVITELTLSADSGDGGNPVMQNISYKSSQSLVSGTTGILGGGIPSYQSGTPVFTKDLDFTIDSKNHEDLNIQNSVLTVSCEFDGGYNHGSEHMDYPYLVSRNYSFDMTIKEKNSNDWFSDEMNTTVQKFTLDLDYGSVVNFNMTNMTVEMTNQGDVGPHGIVERTYRFVPTSDTVVTVSTPS